ncbi:zinc-binding alcohol dehydrogenase family protein [Rhodobacter sp. NTK016B]|uniref:zinc-binding alcohol dehydrogenase family protein n=1 Tax=Rhodobacter sp. NTK016B TaxID=2759676 RepID=UPI001A8FED4C|nr:zinc-binding alcohol dehydrogenase family protein [Rhodobacter sp. NTK016B]MBN8293301.1 zinc-binding alcohol dehydrogenase family protein [Rhodobacter sp. NTK016B]
MTRTFPAVAFNPAIGKLEDVTVPMTEPQGEDLLVRVSAVSVNPVDLRRRQMIPNDAPLVRLGYDAAGVVEAVGPDASGFRPGDRVFYAGAANRDGANGAYHLVDARLVGHAPKSLSDADAAAMPLTALTAWESLFERLGHSASFDGSQPGRLLVINGAGGVGSVALQLAKLAGLHATATASRAQSADWCRAMGAAEVVDHAALAELPDMSFDSILCAYDADGYFETMARLIAPQGMICTILGLRQPQNLMPLFQKSAGIVWEYMFTRSTHATADRGRQGEILTQVAGLMDSGALKTTRSVTMKGLNAQSLQEAHDRLAQERMTGKLVLTL